MKNTLLIFILKQKNSSISSTFNKDNNNNITVLSDTPTLVYTGKSNDRESNTTNVTWKEEEGILLMINDKIINKKEYTANIIWTIEE